MKFFSSPRFVLCALCCGMAVAASSVRPERTAQDERLRLAEEREAREKLSAAELLAACRNNLPTERVTLAGKLTLLRRRGFPDRQNWFTLEVNWGADPSTAVCQLFDRRNGRVQEKVVLTRARSGEAEFKRFAGPEMKEQPAPLLSSKISETDLTWLELTMDFLWWPNPTFDTTPETVRRHRGEDCFVLLASPPKPIPGCGAVRMWLSKRTGFLMKAEQLDLMGDVTNYFWMQTAKKFGDRWMLRELRAKTAGSSREALLKETRLYVETLDDEELGYD